MRAPARFWFTLSPAGVLAGYVALWFSLTPSLLPRPPLIQGVMSAALFVLAYSLGAAVAQLLKEIAKKLPRQAAKQRAKTALSPVAERQISRRRTKTFWILFGTALTISIVPLTFKALAWQNEVRQLVGLTPTSFFKVSSFVPIFVGITTFGIFLGKLFRKIFRTLNIKVNSFWSATVSVLSFVAAITAILTLALVVVDTVYRNINLVPSANITEPDSEFRSTGPDSLIDWQDLGAHGATFIAGGPSAAQITELTGKQALDPIRVYVGNKSAETYADQATLAVSELERTGAFEREWIMITSPTGLGVVEPKSVDSFEYLLAGNTAVVALQYSYTPSWVSYVLDRDASIASLAALFDAVSARLQEVPEADRPKLVVQGLSLGAHAAQEIFADLDDLRDRADGALFIGSPDFSHMWRFLTSNRDSGSSVFAPVYEGGTAVRWASLDTAATVNGAAWEFPRVLYLQNPSDPVIWLNMKLLWQKPEWLQVAERFDYIAPSMRWIPAVTATQVTFDMLVCGSLNSCHGHSYGDLAVTSWIMVTGSNDLSDAAIRAVEDQLKTYSTPFFNVSL